MSLSHALILGAIQGLTEFLPISSSAHLYLVQEWMGYQLPLELLSFDLVLHLGTLTALVIVTRRELAGMVRELVRWVGRKPVRDPAARALLVPVIIGTVPALIAGLVLLPLVAEGRSVPVVAATMLAASLYFLLAERAMDRSSVAGRPEEGTTVRDAVWIGFAQAAAGLFTGLSRSGVTIATGMLRGLTREGAARFSFLLSIPIILASGLHGALELRDAPEVIAPGVLLAGFLVSAVCGYAAVELFLRYLRHHTLRPFAYYVGAVGVLVLVTSLFA